MVIKLKYFENNPKGIKKFNLWVEKQSKYEFKTKELFEIEEITILEEKIIVQYSPYTEYTKEELEK